MDNKTRSQFDAAIFLAGKFFGPEVTISAIDEAKLAHLFRTMRALPSNHHTTPTHAAMALEQIAAGNKGKGLSSATTNRHMRFLKVVLDWPAKRVLGCAVIDWSAPGVAQQPARVAPDQPWFSRLICSPQQECHLFSFWDIPAVPT